MSSINEPIRIGTMLVKNRTVLPPMNSNYSNELGGVTPQMIEFYADRAKKGVGLMVMEHFPWCRSQRTMAFSR